MDANTPGARIRSARKRAGVTQKELAAASGVSLAWIRDIEQEREDRGTPRLETLHRLASALQVRTSALVVAGDAEDADPQTAEDWQDVRRALAGLGGEPPEEPTPEGVTTVMDGLRPALAANRFGEVRALLPALLRDARALNGDGRPVRSRVLNLSAWMLTMTRQWDAAETAARLAADAADDRLDAAAATNTAVWSLLRQGRLAEASAEAESAADEIEPKFSRATVRELALWGRLLLGVTNAAVRDNRPGAADDALSLARAAADRIGREVGSDTSTARTFGPVSVAMIGAENAALRRRPEQVLKIAGAIPRDVLHPQSASRLRHRLDVAHAMVMLRRYPEAMGVLGDLRATAPEWLPQQRYARDIMGAVVEQRRTLTGEMRSLADAVRLPL